jgi:hypothetical protein
LAHRLTSCSALKRFSSPAIAPFLSNEKLTAKEITGLIIPIAAVGIALVIFGVGWPEFSQSLMPPG